MTPGTVALLVLSSLANATIGAGAFLFGAFATDPAMSDVTMRVGWYVLNLIVLAAATGVVAPWILVVRGQRRSALVLAALPAFLAIAAVLAFLTLDSWLSRNFGG